MHGLAYSDRLLAMAARFGYAAPKVVTDHALERWIQRWRPAAFRGDAYRELHGSLRHAVIAGFSDKERCSFWELQTVHAVAGEMLPAVAKLVVSDLGSVKTVLPPWAERTNRRPRK